MASKNNNNKSKKKARCRCPVCGISDTSSLFRKGAMPLYNLKKHESLSSALKAETGKVHFQLCNRCSFVFNSEYDASRMKYDVNYESSRAHSKFYQDYMSQVVREIDDEFTLSNKTLVDVGCGGGEFLKEVSIMFPAVRVYGFDPSINGEMPKLPNLTFVKDYFYPKSSGVSPDTIVLRHTVEHIPDIHAFLSSILPESPEDGKPGKELGIYIEVPSWEWIADNNSFYAFSYEHCSYYSAASIKIALSQHGFSSKKISFSFKDEYLQYFGTRPVAWKEMVSLEPAEKTVKKTNDFNQRLPIIISTMKEMILSLPKETVLWGGAGKGTTLLNMLDIGRDKIAYVIDSNPHRWDSYIPRTGQKIVNPEMLKELKPKNVLITNNAYHDEIRKQLDHMELKAKIISIDSLLRKNKIANKKPRRK